MTRGDGEVGPVQGCVFSGGRERFDIVAKAPTSATPDTLRGMMRGLLAERFELATHNQDKLTQAYVLTAAKGAPAIRATSGGQTFYQE